MIGSKVSCWESELCNVVPFVLCPRYKCFVCKGVCPFGTGPLFRKSTRCEPLAQSCYLVEGWLGVESGTSRSPIQCPNLWATRKWCKRDLAYDECVLWQFILNSCHLSSTCLASFCYLCLVYISIWALLCHFLSIPVPHGFGLNCTSV